MGWLLSQFTYGETEIYLPLIVEVGPNTEILGSVSLALNFRNTSQFHPGHLKIGLCNKLFLPQQHNPGFGMGGPMHNEVPPPPNMRGRGRGGNIRGRGRGRGGFGGANHGGYMNSGELPLMFDSTNLTSVISC